MSARPEKDNQESIAEQLPYLNELMTAIRNVNDAILQNKDAREAAENLLSDLPDDWLEDIADQVNAQRKAYNTIVDEWNKYLMRGFTSSQKYQAQKAIYLAGNNYSRNIKKIVITLLKKKDLLFKTRKKIEEGSLSLWALGESGDVEDD